MDKKAPNYPGGGTVDNPYIVSYSENDQENPQNFPGWKKWLYSLIYAYSMCAGTFSVSSYVSGYTHMQAELHTTHFVSTVGQFTFLIGLALGSLLFPSIGDLVSRKWANVTTLAIFTAFSAGVAGAQNMATVLVCRFFAGFFASCPQVLGPASVPALWPPAEIAVPFTVSATAPFLGPSLGPLIGGYVTQETGSWRNINWVSTGFGGLMTFLCLFVPELFAPAILRSRAKRLTKETGQIHVSMHDYGKVFVVREQAQKYFLMPFLLLLREPILQTFASFVSILYAIQNVFFAAFPFIYRGLRGWQQGNAGLPFLAMCLGLFAAVPVTAITTAAFKNAMRRGENPPPEKRLIFALIGAVFSPICLLWLGWTATPSIHWISPILAGAVYSTLQIGLTMNAMVYLADVYKHQVGTAFQGFNVLRFGLSSVFPLFSLQMYNALGAGVACTILASILFALMPFPFLCYKYGWWLRKKSRYAPIPPEETAEKRIEP